MGYIGGLGGVSCYLDYCYSSQEIRILRLFFKKRHPKTGIHKLYCKSAVSAPCGYRKFVEEARHPKNQAIHKDLNSPSYFNNSVRSSQAIQTIYISLNSLPITNYAYILHMFCCPNHSGFRSRDPRRRPRPSPR